MALYGFAIFTGAFLLFQVQPLIGKYILPWFGGTPGVWTTCLLFFQCMLLAGYAYAHLLTRWLSLRQQAVVHGFVLFLALWTLPISPAESLKPVATVSPVGQILKLLLLTLGLPYLALAATGPLLQAWFSKANPGRSPYRLYALSNVGSLLALITFPFVFEPATTRTQQVYYWSGGMVFFALACAFIAWRLWQVVEEDKKESSAPPAPPPPWPRVVLWFLLPACGTTLLMSITNKMCQDIAVVPFLWVLPLGLYLGTFIICFDSPRWYHRAWWTRLLVLSWVGVWFVLKEGLDLNIAYQVGLLSAVMFFGCMICHGELYRLRPEPARLTHYFLAIAAGGALGGLFVSLGAPHWFDRLWEFQVAIVACPLMYTAVCVVERIRWRIGRGHLMVVLAICWAAVIWALFRHQPFTWKTTMLAGTCTLALAWGGTWVAFQWAQRQQEALIWRQSGSACAGTLIALLAVIGVLVWTDHFPRFHPAIWGCSLLLLVNCFVWVSLRGWVGARVPGWIPLGILVVVLGALLGRQARDSIDPSEIHASRNFYGSLLVQEYRAGTDDHSRTLINGRITHGNQLLSLPTFATTYYGEESGFGQVMNFFHETKGRLRLGMVGLGTGTAAAHARVGDVVRFYEINPEVDRIAGTNGDLFTYLKAARKRKAKVDVMLGDARLTMDREARTGKFQGFDVLALDAFSSDAIPVHLLTREAFDVYQKHLARDANGTITGALAIHTSNRYLDLNPVVTRLAHEFKMQAVIVDRFEDDAFSSGWVDSTDWVLVTANPKLLAHMVSLQDAHEGTERQNEIQIPEAAGEMPLWTDDYTSLTPIIEWPEEATAKAKKYGLLAGLVLVGVLVVAGIRRWWRGRSDLLNPFDRAND